jgi:hypothetical protein
MGTMSDNGWYLLVVAIVGSYLFWGILYALRASRKIIRLIPRRKVPAACTHMDECGPMPLGEALRHEAFIRALRNINN